MSASSPGLRGSPALSTAGRSVLGGIPKRQASPVRGSPSEMARSILDSQSLSSVSSNRGRDDSREAQEARRQAEIRARETRARQEAQEKKAEEKRFAEAQAKIKADQEGVDARRTESRGRRQERTRSARESSPTKLAARKRIDESGGIDSAMAQAGNAVLGGLRELDPTMPNLLRVMGDENRKSQAASRQRSSASAARRPASQASSTSVTASASDGFSPPPLSPTPSPPPVLDSQLDILEEAGSLSEEGGPDVRLPASASSSTEADSNLNPESELDALIKEAGLEGDEFDAFDAASASEVFLPPPPPPTHVVDAPSESPVAPEPLDEFQQEGIELLATSTASQEGAEVDQAMQGALDAGLIVAPPPPVPAVEDIASPTDAAVLEAASVGMASPQAGPDAAVLEGVDGDSANDEAAEEEGEIFFGDEDDLPLPVEELEAHTQAPENEITDNARVEVDSGPHAPQQDERVPDAMQASVVSDENELDDDFPIMNDEALAESVGMPSLQAGPIDAGVEASPEADEEAQETLNPASDDTILEDLDLDDSLEGDSDLHPLQNLVNVESMRQAGVPDDNAAAIAAAQNSQEMAEALERLAARSPIAIVFVSDPEQASAAFSSVTNILGGDESTKDKVVLIEGLAQSCEDTAFKFYAGMVSATLEGRGDNPTEEQRTEGLEILKQKFSFLADNGIRTPEESCEDTYEAFEGAYEEVHANLKPAIGEAFDQVLKTIQETAAPQFVEVESAVDTSAAVEATLAAAKPTPSADLDDDEIELDADEAAAEQGKSSEITFKNKGNWKQGAIVAGKGATALALAAALPGFGFILAIIFLAATKNIGADKKDHSIDEQEAGDVEQTDALQKLLQDMDKGKQPQAAIPTASAAGAAEEKEKLEAAAVKPAAAAAQTTPAVPAVAPVVISTDAAPERPAVASPSIRPSIGPVSSAIDEVTNEMHTTLGAQAAGLEASRNMLHSVNAETGITSTDVLRDPSLHPMVDFSIGAATAATATPTDASAPSAPLVSASVVAADSSTDTDAVTHDPDAVTSVSAGEVIDEVSSRADHRSFLGVQLLEQERAALGGLSVLSDVVDQEQLRSRAESLPGTAMPERGGVGQG